MFSAEGMALTPAPPDTRTWEVAYASFFNAQSTGHRSDDAARLFALDPSKTVSLLLRALERQQPEELRLRAVWGMSAVQSPAGLEPLLKIASDPSESIRIRNSAINVMAYFPDARITKLCLEILKQKDRELLNAAAQTLAVRKSPEGVSAIRDAFEFATTDQLPGLLYSLLTSGDPEASAFVFKNVPAPTESSSDDLRFSYALLMMQQPSRETEPFMTKLLHGKDRWCKAMAFAYFRTFPNEYVAQDLLKALDDTKESPAFGTSRSGLIEAFLAAPLVSERTKEKLRQKKPLPRPSPFAGFPGQ
jgi:hypothetical protein